MRDSVALYNTGTQRFKLRCPVTLDDASHDDFRIFLGDVRFSAFCLVYR
jgi:hypothetical protein